MPPHQGQAGKLAKYMPALFIEDPILAVKAVQIIINPGIRWRSTGLLLEHTEPAWWK